MFSKWKSNKLNLVNVLQTKANTKQETIVRILSTSNLQRASHTLTNDSGLQTRSHVNSHCTRGSCCAALGSPPTASVNGVVDRLYTPPSPSHPLLLGQMRSSRPPCTLSGAVGMSSGLFHHSGAVQTPSSVSFFPRDLPMNGVLC